MESEFDLPPLPVSHVDPTPDLSALHYKRKRPRLDHDITTSSDPALFSSDDHAPTAENYTSKRRKQKWHGTWWGERVKSQTSEIARGQKRGFTRNFDSGVWMGSEGTDTSIEDGFLEETTSCHRQGSILNFSHHKNKGITSDTEDDAATSERIDRPQLLQLFTDEKPSRAASSPSINTVVEHIINRCLEAGDENVDLSSMFLEDVPNESLKRLRSLTKHSTIQDFPPSQEAYSPIEPALRLYLSNNSLTNFPSEILSLTNLRLLSLRHNKLTKLPPAIAKLPSLEQLNIAANELQYLPFEMLSLYDRPEFDMIATPNPFQDRQPEHEVSYQRALPSSTSKMGFLKARSPPQYFHPDGSKALHNPQQPAADQSNVPSLFELALQKCQQLPDLIEIQEWCTPSLNGEEAGPTTLSKPLALAQEANAHGGRLECTVCGRPFIVPRVQWTEWWLIRLVTMLTTHTQEIESQCPINAFVVPFLRQGCSWACVVGNTSEEESNASLQQDVAGFALFEPARDS